MGTMFLRFSGGDTETCNSLNMVFVVNIANINETMVHDRGGSQWDKTRKNCILRKAKAKNQCFFTHFFQTAFPKSEEKISKNTGFLAFEVIFV